MAGVQRTLVHCSGCLHGVNGHGWSFDPSFLGAWSIGVRRLESFPVKGGLATRRCMRNVPGLGKAVMCEIPRLPISNGFLYIALV